MKKTVIGILAVAAVLSSLGAAEGRRGPWTKEKAWDWYRAQPWMRGANYMSKSCCNRVDQWQEHGFEERFKEQEEELALAESIGFNTMRILLLSEGFDVWLQDHDGFMRRFDRTLDLLAKHGMRAIVVLGNDCSRPERSFAISKLGPQKVDWGYHGGRGFSQHGSAPNEVGYIVADHPTLGPKFFAFCEEVLRTHAHDKRIVVWNLWNEPGANNRQQKGLSPLRKIFELAWRVNPDQPLMADIWRTYGRDPNDLCESYAAANSDVISYHCYGDIAEQVALIKDLRTRYGRPLLLTEWLCRMTHNCVEDAYPLYEMEGVAAFAWGFVNGKYQTHEPWECIWTDVKNGKGDQYNFREWFHDLYRPSLRPYDPKEIDVIRRVNADADADRAGTSLRKRIEKACGPVEADLWYGFRRWKFKFQGHDAWVVEPSTKTADGRPWTWTIQWSEHFVDRTGVLDLLRRGWHHVFVDGYEERGSDRGVARFADFQEMLVSRLGLAPKTCLVGMSWGGFFSVRYAAAHPENVAKLYLDAPLLTFAPGFDEEIGPWEKAKPADGDWLKDPRMPVNMAAKIAVAKIPVLLLYGGQDQSVPRQLNAEKFVADFRAAGGVVTVDCRELFGHHPHGTDPDKTSEITDFFEKATPPADDAWPFAILRSYGSYADNRLFTERVFAAQERHPGLFGEIWFGGDGGLDYTAEERGKRAAEKNAGIRERCHELGIAFSYQQGVTLNHGPDGLRRDFIPEDAWAVNRDGKVDRGLLCCTSPWALDYQRETAKAVMRRLQPDSYWPDDDLRLLKGDWKAAYYCFCDRCVKLFGESYGKAFTRETLVKALNGPEASADVRKAWCAFNGRNLGACAKVYREAADAVSPKTRLGIQIALSGNTVDGDSWKTMVEALAGEKGKAGTRPGGLYYTDFNPHDLPSKMVLVAREAARSGALPQTGQICYEVENWPHVGGHKNAHAMMAECAWALAAGCDSVAFYWGADQNGEDAASYDYWLDTVWAWRPFQRAVRDAFVGTALGGVAAYHGANHWATDGWANHDEGEVSALMSCGVPVTVSEAAPDVWWLNERCVGTLAECDLKTVFARPVLMSAAAFAALGKRFPKLDFVGKVALAFPEGEKALATAKRANGYELFPSGLKSANVKAFVYPKSADVKTFSTMTADAKACGTCVIPTAFGGKVVVAQEVPGHWPHAVWPGGRRRAILDALDAATPGGLPARLLTDGYSVAITVRKTADGKTAGVFLFNLGLGETPPLEVAINRGACAKWRVSMPQRETVPAEVVRRGVEGLFVVRVPPLKAFSAALIGE